jgi:hypothetical protein
MEHWLIEVTLDVCGNSLEYVYAGFKFLKLMERVGTQSYQVLVTKMLTVMCNGGLISTFDG